MKITDFAELVRSQIQHVTHCERMHLFICIETGQPRMACERSDLADTYLRSKAHLFVGTYDRRALFGQILTDLLQAIDDADRARLRTIELHHITGRACPL